MPHPHTRRKSHRFTILHRFIFWIQKDLCKSVKSVGPNLPHEEKSARRKTQRRKNKKAYKL